MNKMFRKGLHFWIVVLSVKWPNTVGYVLPLPLLISEKVGKTFPTFIEGACMSQINL